MDISIVIPLFNEDESLPELHDWIDRVMQANNFSYEIVFVDDGSKDTSAALNVGFEAARGNVIITMDADLQDSPEEIPGLYKMIIQDGYDLVSGWKEKRYDPITKTIPTKLFNAATRKMSGIKLHDFNCGLKAYRCDVVKSIEVYGEMHRYIPVIAKRAGFTKIGEKSVSHQARKYGTTKFGFERFVNGFLDLLSISFVTKFGKRPMHFFGLNGTLMFVLGFGGFAYLIINKLWVVYHNHSVAARVTESPWFYISLVAMVIGTQLFLAGFIAELLARNSPDRNTYLIEKKVGEGGI